MKKKNSFLSLAPRHYVINIIGVSLVLLLIGGFLMWLNMSVDTFNTDEAINAGIIYKLEKELDELNRENTYEVEDVRTILNSASVAGNKVAKYQTNYMEHSLELSDQLFEQNVIDLSNCFTFDGQDGRVPWYVPVGVNPIWKFKNTYSFSGDNLDVVWVCELEKTSEILAYATAVYHAKEDRFSNTVWYVTGEGVQYIGITEDLNPFMDANGDTGGVHD